nr:reverse transcriptase domain-containing protein [Tanacetum cinerariifolium]
MSRREDVPKVTLPPRKRLCIALGMRFEVSESSFTPIARTMRGFKANYRFVGTFDNEIRRDPKREDDRLLMSGQLNMLRRDRRPHARITRLVESEARLSREAWKMASKRTTRSTPSTTTTTTTTPLTNAQLKVKNLHALSGEAQGHFKRECPKLKSNNHGNQGRNGNAPAKVYAVGRARTNPDSNIITELGSLDIIIGMDWMAKYHTVIVCTEKIVRIPWGNETSIVHGDEDSFEHHLMY